MADYHGDEKNYATDKVKDASDDYGVNHAGEPVGEEFGVDRKLQRQLKNRHIAMIRYVHREPTGRRAHSLLVSVVLSVPACSWVPEVPSGMVALSVCCSVTR